MSRRFYPSQRVIEAQEPAGLVSATRQGCRNQSEIWMMFLVWHLQLVQMNNLCTILVHQQMMDLHLNLLIATIVMKIVNTTRTVTNRILTILVSMILLMRKVIVIPVMMTMLPFLASKSWVRKCTHSKDGLCIITTFKRKYIRRVRKLQMIWSSSSLSKLKIKIWRQNLSERKRRQPWSHTKSKGLMMQQEHQEVNY